MIRRRNLSIILIAAVLVGALGFYPQAALAAPVEGFASPQIRAVWERDDAAVTSGKAGRSWMWGPGPFHTTYEAYADAPDGNHLVQYFDKGRLEINDPNGDKNSPWFVTSGLLVKEMMAGKAQVGDNAVLDLGPARVAVVGDDPAAGPSYADLGTPAISGRAADLTGKQVGCLFTPGRTLPKDVDRPLTYFEQASGHNWAEPFRRFAEETLGGRQLQILGYPITEPCAVATTIGGRQQNVLVQLFERRTLTFNPNNPTASQVEMGNVGRHYSAWRYRDVHPANLNTSYDVRITVGSAPARSMHVVEKIRLTNTTPASLDRVVLRAVWNHWKGVLTVAGARVNGSEAATEWKQGINLVVRLPQAVPPGQQVALELAVDLKPRPVGGRTGYDRASDVLSIGDALPTVVPWENGGWLYYPYSNLGDYGYYDASNYVVTVASHSGERLVVGGTGVITNVSADRSSWTFEAKGVRDVAYIMSPRFINPLDDASMTRQEGKVTMLSYFLPEHRAQGQRQLELCGPALAWLSANIGEYPFTTYTIAEMGVPLERTDNYAQEYPMAYFVPSSWLSLGTEAPSWTWYTPVHEVAHQWFYSTIGNNQLEDPWLDEAFATYITAEYVRANFPAHYARSWASMTASATGVRPVSAGIYSGFASENQYSAVIYDSGSRMLDRVRRAMGDDDFYAALRDYYQTYKFKRATTANLTTTLQKHTKADLGSIFAEYLEY
jgi:hypothetical protein